MQIGGNLATWKSKTCAQWAKAEYRNMAHGVYEVLWLRTLLSSPSTTQFHDALAMRHYGGTRGNRQWPKRYTMGDA